MSHEHIYEAGKSFWTYANSRECNGCFGCGYCILSSVGHIAPQGNLDTIKPLEIGDPPGKLDPRMKAIPVAVNNAYGDPTLQWEDTLNRLEQLRVYDHRGVVALITKGKLTEKRVRELKNQTVGLKFVTFQSVSGLEPPIEYGNYKQRIDNIQLLVDSGIPVVPYLRPIIPGFNDSEEFLDETIRDVSTAGARLICYAGLMGKEEVLSRLNGVLGEEVKPPKGFDRWEEDLKLVSPKCRSFIETTAKDAGLEVYRKTSCAASMAVGLPHDYNLHMYRPHKYECCECKNWSNCDGARNTIDRNRVQATLDILSTEGNIYESADTTPCPLKSICEYSQPTCTTSERYRLELKGVHTLGEIALSRWLAGIPVSAQHLVDTTQIPDLWNK